MSVSTIGPAKSPPQSSSIQQTQESSTVEVASKDTGRSLSSVDSSRSKTVFQDVLNFINPEPRSAESSSDTSVSTLQSDSSTSIRNDSTLSNVRGKLQRAVKEWDQKAPRLSLSERLQDTPSIDVSDKLKLETENNELYKAAVKDAYLEATELIKEEHKSAALLRPSGRGLTADLAKEKLENQLAAAADKQTAQLSELKNIMLEYGVSINPSNDTDSTQHLTLELTPEKASKKAKQTDEAYSKLQDKIESAHVQEHDLFFGSKTVSKIATSIMGTLRPDTSALSTLDPHRFRQDLIAQDKSNTQFALTMKAGSLASNIMSVVSGMATGGLGSIPFLMISAKMTDASLKAQNASNQLKVKDVMPRVFDTQSSQSTKTIDSVESSENYTAMMNLLKNDAGQYSMEMSEFLTRDIAFTTSDGSTIRGLDALKTLDPAHDRPVPVQRDGESSNDFSARKDVYNRLKKNRSEARSNHLNRIKTFESQLKTKNDIHNMNKKATLLGTSLSAVPGLNIVTGAGALAVAGTAWFVESLSFSGRTLLMTESNSQQTVVPEQRELGLNRS